MAKQLIKVEPELASGKDGTVGKGGSGSDFWKEGWPDPGRFNLKYQRLVSDDRKNNPKDNFNQEIWLIEGSTGDIGTFVASSPNITKVTLLRTFKVRSIITMFSINSLTGFNFITRNVWLSYSQPTVHRFTENGNISGSIEVSMYLKPTLNTFERMSLSIPFIDMSTDRAFLTCVSRVNSYNRFTNSLSLISDKLFKFIERPIIKFPSKIYSSGSALNSYAGQIFNSKNVKRHSHNFFRDTVIDFGNKPLLFPANLPEKFFSRFSAFALKFRSKKCVLCSHVFDWLAIEKSIIGSHGDINNSPINSKNLIANGFR